MSKDSAFSLADQAVYPWNDQGQPVEPGITKRELFAAMAMQGMMSARVRECEDTRYETYARSAVKQADALVTELEKVQS